MSQKFFPCRGHKKAQNELWSGFVTQFFPEKKVSNEAKAAGEKSDS